MLTLGVRPRRDPEALFAGLLVATAPNVPAEPHSMIGSTCIAASAVGASDDVSDKVVTLDIAPSLSPPPARAYLVHATGEQLDDAIALDTGSPLVVFCSGGDVVETTATIDRAGHHTGIDFGADEDVVADSLAVVAHAEHGFFAAASDAAGVLAVLAGTVAALRGDDVRAALRSPDLQKLVSLHPDAAAATRGVLLGILVPDAPGIAATLTERVADARHEG